MSLPDDDDPADDWEERPTVAEENPAVTGDTARHETLAFAAGREQGWTECALAYGEAIEADILASGGTPADAKRIRRWFDLKVQRSG